MTLYCLNRCPPCVFFQVCFIETMEMSVCIFTVTKCVPLFRCVEMYSMCVFQRREHIRVSWLPMCSFSAPHCSSLVGQSCALSDSVELITVWHYCSICAWVTFLCGMSSPIWTSLLAYCTLLLGRKCSSVSQTVLRIVFKWSLQNNHNETLHEKVCMIIELREQVNLTENQSLHIFLFLVM